MMDRDRLVIGTVEITSSTIVVTADGCNFVKEGDFNLQGEWRLVKLVDMICIFLEGVMVFEQHLEGPECMAGNVVQYLSFNQEGILYQRTKKGQFLMTKFNLIPLQRSQPVKYHFSALKLNCSFCFRHRKDLR